MQLRPLFPQRDQEKNLSSYWHRQMIGYLGFFLPPLLLVMNKYRPTGRLPWWPPLSSVSAYHYTAAVTLFAGILFALAVYLFFYQGYEKKYPVDRIVAFAAAFAAIGVAFFPTGVPKQFSVDNSWWTKTTGRIHDISAFILFGAFIIFCLYLFRQSEGPEDRGKKWRNFIYLFCGLGMIGSILWLGILKYLNGDQAEIFLPEALALEFFAVSWLTKGRAGQTAIAFGNNALYYGLRPAQLVGKVRGSLQASLTALRN